MDAMGRWDQIEQSLLQAAQLAAQAPSDHQHELMRNMAQAAGLDYNHLSQSQQQMQAQLAAATQGTNRVTPEMLAQRAREMFLKRMGGIKAELRIAADDFLQCHIYQDTVYLFYCFGGRDGCVKEGIDLFPSDQLITQFRLVLAAG